MSPTLLKCRTRPRSARLSLPRGLDRSFNTTSPEKLYPDARPEARPPPSRPLCCPVCLCRGPQTPDSRSNPGSAPCQLSEPGRVLELFPRLFPPSSRGDLRPGLASLLQGALGGHMNTEWKGILEWRSVVRRWHDGFMKSEDSSGPDECQGSVSKAQSLAQKEHFFLLRQRARYLYIEF